MSDNDNPEVRIVTSLPGAARARWSPEPCVTDFESFVAWLKDHDGKGDKTSRPYLGGTLKRSPGRRRNDNLDLRYVATLDADKADKGFLAHARKVLGSMGLRAEIHTTASHDPSIGKYRYRVEVPFDRGAEPAEYLSITSHLIKKIGVQYFDRQASTSPAHVAYAPATPGVEWASLPGKAIPLDDWALTVEPLDWHPTDSIGAITLDEWREAHAHQDPSCHYGREALDGVIERMESIKEGEGVHTDACYYAARRAVELVGAGCWNLDDVDTLKQVALGLRKEQRPNEFREALVSALEKGDEGKTECGIHRQDLEPWEGDDLEGETTDDRPGGLETLDLVALLDPDRPPRRHLWFGICPTGDHTSVVAPAGVGKSLLVLGLVLAALKGDRQFIGRALDFNDDAHVWYVDMENSHDDWVERLTSYGLDQESIALLAPRLHVLSLQPLSGLDTPRGTAQLTAWLGEGGVKAGDLLVLDSTQRVTEGEENSNDTLRGMDRTNRWLKARGVTVVRTDNTGKDVDRGARGAMNKIDDVGYSFLLKPVGDRKKGRFALENLKHRGAGDGGNLVFDRTYDEDGHLAWLPVVNDGPVTDFDELDEHDANLVLVTWLLTEPSSGPNFEKEWVAQNRITGMATGATDARRVRLEQLVARGYVRKENLPLAKDPTQTAASPSYSISEKGRGWVADQGEDWVASQGAFLARRVPVAEKKGRRR